jgi:hypothetical protein
MDSNILLQQLLKYSYNTDYGKIYNVEKINNIKEFKENIPIVRYDDIFDFISKSYNSVQQALVNEPIIFWALTSGYSSLPKRIPITQTSYDTFRKATQPLFQKIFEVYGEHIFAGKILPLVGKYEIEKSTLGLPVGAISGLMMNASAGKLSNLFAVDLNYANSLSWDNRWSYFIESSIRNDIRCIFVANPAYVLKLLEIGIQNKFNLNLCEIENGYSLWPNLKVIICMTGGDSSFHLNKLKKYFPSTAIWDGGIGASEGYFFSPTFTDKPIVIPNSQYYFFEFKECNSNSNQTIQFDELEYDKQYELIVTTNYGFLRYNTLDVYKKLSDDKVLFCGRSSIETSFFGERITEQQVEMVIKKLFTKHNIFDGSYCLEGINSKKKYVLSIIVQENQYIEMLRLSDILKDDFDRIMQDTNVNYKYSRKLYNVLEQPDVKIVNESSFELLSNTPKPYLKAQEKMKHLILQ